MDRDKIEGISVSRGRNIEISIEDISHKSFLTYSTSIIISRAIPAASDGLKPVQRRILYAMYEMGLNHTAATKKSAAIVGNILGRYHPHGDASVYAAMAHLSQDFILNFPLIYGQGNWGSIDGDSAAAARYTEARLTNVAEEMLLDIDKDTVDYSPNYDGTRDEPVLLPARFPLLLVTGVSGVAVGFSTSIPPNNLGEVINALLLVHKKPDATIVDIMKLMPGPDLPTGGIIAGNFNTMYSTGKGPFSIYGETEVDEKKNQVIITSIPYRVDKSDLLAEIVKQVKNDKIKGITNIKDISKKDIRVIISIKKGFTPKMIIDQLYHHTQLKISFNSNFIVVDQQQPKSVNLKDLLNYYLAHRADVIARRTVFDIAKCKYSLLIKNGLLKAIQQIDDVIKIIRGKKQVPIDKAVKKFLGVNNEQVTAILDMKIHQLQSLEEKKLIDEIKGLEAELHRLESVVVKDEITKDLQYLKKYVKPRKTIINNVIASEEVKDVSVEVPDIPMYIIINQDGFIKRSSDKIPLKGVQDVVMSSTRSKVLIITSIGKAHQFFGYELDESSGRLLQNLKPGEKPVSIIDLNATTGEFVYSCTKMGLVRKTLVSEYMDVSRKMFNFMKVRPGDELIRLFRGPDNITLFVATDDARGIHFASSAINSQGKLASGVRSIKAVGESVCVGLCRVNAMICVANNEGNVAAVDIQEFGVKGKTGKGMAIIRKGEKISDINSPSVSGPPVIRLNGQQYSLKNIKMINRARSIK